MDADEGNDILHDGSSKASAMNKHKLDRPGTSSSDEKVGSAGAGIMAITVGGAMVRDSFIDFILCFIAKCNLNVSWVQ